MSVAYGHWPEENQVSKVSGSFSHPSPGESSEIFTLSPLYQAGIGMPHQVCREMGQSRISLSQVFKKLALLSGLITTSPDSMASLILSRKALPLISFVIATYHWGMTRGSMRLLHL